VFDDWDSQVGGGGEGDAEMVDGIVEVA